VQVGTKLFYIPWDFLHIQLLKIKTAMNVNLFLLINIKTLQAGCCFKTSSRKVNFYGPHKKGTSMAHTKKSEAELKKMG